MALKIACGQIEIIAGRPDLNTKKILRHMDMACQNGIDILLLPELAVPGYFLGDLSKQPSSKTAPLTATRSSPLRKTAASCA